MKYLIMLIPFCAIVIQLNSQVDSTHNNNDWERIQELMKANLLLENQNKLLKDSSEYYKNQFNIALKVNDSLQDINEKFKILQKRYEDVVKLNKEANEAGASITQGYQLLKTENEKLKIQIEKINTSTLKEENSKLKSQLEEALVNQKSLSDSVRFQQEIIKKLHNKEEQLNKLKEEMVEIKKENIDQTKRLLENNSIIDSLFNQIETKSSEIKDLNVLKKQRIDLLFTTVTHVVNSSNFDPNNPIVLNALNEIEELFTPFPKNEKLKEAKNLAMEYLIASELLNEVNLTLESKFDQNKVNNMLQKLSSFKSSINEANKIAKSLQSSISNYCGINNEIYNILIGVDIYGNSKYKKEDIEFIRPKAIRYPYLIKALDAKINSGYEKGSPMVSKENCNN